MNSSKIQIVNKRDHVPTSNDFFVGRGSPLGNQWDWRGSKLALYVCKDRKEAIENYTSWLAEQIVSGNQKVLAELRKIWKLVAKGETVYLVCFCAPDNDCHARPIKEFILSQFK